MNEQSRLVVANGNNVEEYSKHASKKRHTLRINQGTNGFWIFDAKASRRSRNRLQGAASSFVSVETQRTVPLRHLNNDYVPRKFKH